LKGFARRGFQYPNPAGKPTGTVMNAKNGIKIVKREERSGKSAGEAKSGGAQNNASQPSPTQRAARQVATWVKEFQQRRVEKGLQSFDSLFQRA
jgi:positive regulator of sigma E activity